MQSVSSRIWTRVAVSISYDHNHYTTGTSKDIIILAYPRNNDLTKIKDRSNNIEPPIDLTL